jgi:hypothetical protein
MQDGDYKISPFLKWHRFGSLAVTLGVSLWSANHVYLAIGVRFMALSIFPLALIWFAEQLAGVGKFRSHGWLRLDQEDIAVRVIGWLILLCGAAWFVLVQSQRRPGIGWDSVQ